MGEYSKMIYEKVKAFLDADEWHYSFREEGIFEMGLKMESAISSIRIIIIVENDCFQVRSILPVGVDVRDENKLVQLLMFVTKVNYQSKIGSFIVDINDGEIAYKVHVDCDGIDDIGNEIVKKSVMCSVYMFKRYMPGLEALLFLGDDADTAFEKCECEEKKRLMEILVSLENGKHVSE